MNMMHLITVLIGACGFPEGPVQDVVGDTSDLTSHNDVILSI